MMTRYKVLEIISQWLSKYVYAHGVAILSRRHVTGLSRWGWELRVESVYGQRLSCHWDDCGGEFQIAMDIDGEIVDFLGTKKGLTEAVCTFEVEHERALRLEHGLFVGDTGFDAVQIQRRSPVIAPVIVAPALDPKPARATGAVMPKEPKPVKARKDRFDLIEI